MKIPKRLLVDRSCFYQLPESIPLPDLTPYELMFRRKYPGVFHSRIGYYYLFTFSDPATRDAFLSSLERNARQGGLLVEQATITT